jgi:hypothetical protein
VQLFSGGGARACGRGFPRGHRPALRGQFLCEGGGKGDVTGLGRTQSGERGRIPGGRGVGILCD